MDDAKQATPPSAQLSPSGIHGPKCEALPPGALTCKYGRFSGPSTDRNSRDTAASSSSRLRLSRRRYTLRYSSSAVQIHIGLCQHIRAACAVCRAAGVQRSASPARPVCARRAHETYSHQPQVKHRPMRPDHTDHQRDQLEPHAQATPTSAGPHTPNPRPWLPLQEAAGAQLELLPLSRPSPQQHFTHKAPAHRSLAPGPPT